MVRGWVVGPVFGSWVTAWVSSGCGCGSAWLGRGRGSAAEVGRWSWLGRGWVVAEVAPVMIFFEWVCSSGFQIGWVSNRGWVVVVVCSGRVWVSNRLW